MALPQQRREIGERGFQGRGMTSNPGAPLKELGQGRQAHAGNVLLHVLRIVSAVGQFTTSPVGRKRKVKQWVVVSSG